MMATIQEIVVMTVMTAMIASEKEKGGSAVGNTRSGSSIVAEIERTATRRRLPRSPAMLAVRARFSFVIPWYSARRRRRMHRRGDPLRPENPASRETKSLRLITGRGRG